MIEEVKGSGNPAPKPKTRIGQYDTRSISDSIFQQMDKNSDQVVTPEEAKAFGYTTLGEKNLSKEDFFEKYKAFKEKTSTQSGIIQDFREHFDTPQSRSLNKYVQLNASQIKELISRLEMFEATQKVLPEDKKYSPEETAYIKEGVNDFMNQDLAEYLEQFSANRSISDGKIGSFRQGKFADCWFLSALNSYISTEEGRKNIENRIKNNGDGTYNVTFQNPFDQNKAEIYTITDSELNGKYKNGATGDIDVKILEAAANKHLEKYAPECLRLNGTMLTNDLIVKPAIMHKAFGYQDDIQFFIKEDDGKIYKRTTSVEKHENGRAKVTLDYDNCEYTSFNDLIQKSGFKENDLTVSSFSRFQRTPKVTALDMSTESSLLPDSHAYNLEKMTDDACVINNPYRSSFPLAVKKDVFEELIKAVYYFPTQNKNK